MNKLPSKLNFLRRNCGLSQGDMAQRLMVPVSEYMNWENGNSIPSIYQLKTIAELFHVDLSALVDNTVTFVAPTNLNDQSATIPFNGNVQSADTNEQTKEVDLGSTKVMDTNEFSTVDEENEEDDDAEDLEDEKEEPKQKIKKVKKNLFKDKKTMMIAGGAVGAIILLVIVMFVLKGFGGGKDLTVSNVNRLSLGTTYSVYIDDHGSVKTRGQGPSTASLHGSVQISTYSDWSLGLKPNGSVVSTNSSLDVKDWKDIKQIAAGKDHAVGLKEDGSVVCVGNDNACKVKDWQNVSSVYAGDGVTVALTEGGTFLSSGGVNIPSSETKVKTVSISDNGVYYLKKDGNVGVISLRGAETLSSAVLSNVVRIAAGNDVVAGVKKDGTVVASASDPAIVSEVKNWKDVKYIAAKGNTLVAVTNKGKMYGVGDNQFGQYENSSDKEKPKKTPKPDKEEEKGHQLATVTNIRVSATAENIQIAWDAVRGADYYEVTVDPGIGKLPKSSSTSASIPSSELEDGKTYTVTVVAKSNDAKKNPASEPAVTNYTYAAMKIPLGLPSGLKTSMDGDGSWVISWDAVEHANSYTVSLNGNSDLGSISGTSLTIPRSSLAPNMSYTITVVAHSDDSKFTDSQSSITAQYTPAVKKYQVTLEYTCDGVVVGTESATIDEGTHRAEDIAGNVPAGYTLVGGQQITINNVGKITVNVSSTSMESQMEDK